MKTNTNLKQAARSAFLLLAAFAAASNVNAQGNQNAAPTTSTTNVNVVNTPTVNVGSLPAVSLAGTPTVNIGGTSGPLSVKDSENPARSPAAEFFSIDMVNGAGFAEQSRTVPAGKRWVIDLATFTVSAPIGQAVYVDVRTIAPNLNGTPGLVSHRITLTPQYTIVGFTTYAATAPLRIYADGGTNVAVTVSREFATGFTGTVNLRASLDGSLVPTT